MNFKGIITKDLDNRFCRIQYDEFDLIMMKDNNFINATKLCTLGNKDFHYWLTNKNSKELIEEVKMNDTLNVNKDDAETNPKIDNSSVMIDVGNDTKGEHR